MVDCTAMLGATLKRVRPWEWVRGPHVIIIVRVPYRRNTKRYYGLESREVIRGIFGVSSFSE